MLHPVPSIQILDVEVNDVDVKSTFLGFGGFGLEEKIGETGDFLW